MNEDMVKKKEANYFECNECRFATMNKEEFDFHLEYLHRVKDGGVQKEERATEVSNRKRNAPTKAKKPKTDESGYFSAESSSEETEIPDKRRSNQEEKEPKGRRSYF